MQNLAMQQPDSFIRRWQAGVTITLHTFVLIGVSMAGAGVTAGMLYGALIVLPAEALFHTTAPERYWLLPVLLGCCTWGFEIVGRCKRLILEQIG